MFKFDDIYMGILAARLDIKVRHLENIYYYALPYYPSLYANDVIAAHKFTSSDLIETWAQLKELIQFKSNRIE
jgi:beta-1,3-galactosyltransferase / beta-1,3-N-acetylglucosaminyltransferase